MGMAAVSQCMGIGPTIFSEYLFLMGIHLQLWDLYCITAVVFEIFSWRTRTMGREVSGEGKVWAATRLWLLAPVLELSQAGGALFHLSAALSLWTGLSRASL